MEGISKFVVKKRKMILILTLLLTVIFTERDSPLKLRKTLPLLWG